MQFQAGFILEGVKSDLGNFPEDKINGLLKSLSTFDIDANFDLTHLESEYHPFFYVINNIISRGIPTRPSVFIENYFSENYIFQDCLYPIDSESNGDIVHQAATSDDQKQRIFEALHLIDPRKKGFAREVYNTESLGSNFEESFVFKCLDNERFQFIAQILQTQRSLDTIVPASKMHEFNKQRVDFSFEIPYLNRFRYRKYHQEKVAFRKNIGVVIEIDGAKYHSSLSQLVLDDCRDEAISLSEWEVSRIKEVTSVVEVLDHLVKESDVKDYLKLLSINHKRNLQNDEWRELLEFVLSPFAIARLQKVLLECIMSGALDFSKESWKIRVYERDIPCSQLALEDFIQWLNNIFVLRASQIKEKIEVPRIDLNVISTSEFFGSKLHLNRDRVHLLSKSEDSEFDLVIDISILMRSGIEKLILKGARNVVIRSSHFIQDTRSFYTASQIKYREIITKNEIGDFEAVSDAVSSLEFFLRNIFRKQRFNKGQIPILNRALQNKNVIGLLPTGGGKSLTYQLAGLLQPGISLIIDPIKSLMQDQYTGLLKDGIDACNFINSKLETFEKKIEENRLSVGQVLFSFISPERLQIQSFRELLDAMFKKGIYFSYCVIDEVHCVSEWGHDFRTAYLSLGKNAMQYCKTRSFPNEYITIFGLTATASFDVLADVERELSGEGMVNLDPDAIVSEVDSSRIELQYQIVKVDVNYNFGQPKSLRLSDGQIVNTTVRPIIGKVSDMVAKAKHEKLVMHLKAVPKYLDYLVSKSRNYSEELERVDYQGVENIYNISIDSWSPDTFFNINESNLYKYGGVVFTPHTKGYAGVTDQFLYERLDDDIRDKYGVLIKKSGEFVLDENGKKIKLQPSKRKGVADTIERNFPNLKVGIFRGSSETDEDTTKEVESISFESQEAFINSQIALMVATKAFGMGINKSNVRHTVHYNFPSSLESFIQEAGRAGRDKQLALCSILYHEKTFIHFDKPFLQSIFRECSVSTYNKLIQLQDAQYLIEDCPKLFQEIDELALMNHELFQKGSRYIRNIDRDIQINFHNGSFKGADKEKVILNELLYNISWPRSSSLNFLAKIVMDELEIDDLLLRHKDSRIYCDSSEKRSYGFVDLKGLKPNLRFTDFSRNQSAEVVNTLISFIKVEFNNWGNYNALQSWLTESNNKKAKIGIMSAVQDDGTSLFTSQKIEIPFENEFKANSKFESDLLKAIKERVTPTVSLSDLRSALKDFEYSSSHKFDDFESILGYYCKDFSMQGVSELDRDFILSLFYQSREKADTDKALYRMFSIGVIDDYTIDYNRDVYMVSCTAKPPGYYTKRLFEFVRRYYSEEWTKNEIVRIVKYNKECELEKCLYFLVDFVYKVIEKKRVRAIDDMLELCSIGQSSEGELVSGSILLKEYFYTYFNSKYAKWDYTIDSEYYSLSQATDDGKESSIAIVYKFLRIIEIDGSAPQIDNIKHLRGACVRLLRINSENASLLILKSFAMIVLGTRGNTTLFDEAKKSFINGAKLFLKDNIDFVEVTRLLEDVKKKAVQYGESRDEVEGVMELFLKKVYVLYHTEWVVTFNSNFLVDYNGIQ